jgi:MFS family permease
MGLALLGKERFYGWVALTATALSFLGQFGVVMNSFGAFLPSICTEFGWSRGAVSGAFTMLMVVIGLCGPLAGWVVEKYGPRTAIVAGNLLVAIGAVVLAYHSQVWQLYVGYGLFIALGLGISGMIACTTVANNWFVKKAPLAISIIMTSSGIGSFILIPLIMQLIGVAGWRSTYLCVCGLIVVLGLIVPALFIRNKPEDLGQVPDGVPVSEPGKPDPVPEPGKLYVAPVHFTVKEAVGTGTLWLLVISVTTLIFTMSLFMAHQVAFLIGIGISAGVAGGALGVLMGASTLGTLGMGFLALRFDLKRLNIIATALILIGMVILLFTRSLPMVFTYSVVWGIGYGAALVAGMSLLASYFGRTHYSKLMGIMMLFSTLGTSGAPIAGAIHDATRSYALAFTIGVIAAVIGFLCMILIRPPLHPSLKSAKGQVWRISK